MNIIDKALEERTPPFFRLGFRPFFLVGASYAVIAIALWIWALSHGQPAALQVPALWWHVHEMLFGFAIAIVVGFVLTAVQNWTGNPGTKGWRLALLLALWLSVRVMFWLPVPTWVISVIEGLFLLGVCYEIGWRVVVVKGWRNLFFVPLFLMAIAVNFASYASIKGLTPFSSSAIWQAMLWWFVLLLSVMGGRVIPFFSARRFNYQKAEPLPALEYLATISLLLLFLLSFFPLVYLDLAPMLMLFAGLAQLLRFVRWKPWLCMAEPLVWSLHLAYAFIPSFLIVKGLANNPLLSHSALHIFAIGALGGLILAMISRVTLGHTGRDIYKGPVMWPAFLAVAIAALIRGVAVAWWPTQLQLWLHVSAALWMCGFSMFVLLHAKMLFKARVDGHPG
ncbi:short-chain dehydrogenase [Alginatibacterium sediminis]|uniref:Short-chain dehydrogenase n=1 Tax=Alginatibacterium sediminis TaxID=2164068 RepID=A0A420EDM0_9ALTE|nr:NnrS family protein [Alginatibacterium sediminis]RKF18771.1 short-chain dehydrogenase [Alginatibacterium sediminis]